MFERRLKVLLSVLAGFTLILLLRAGWLQIVQGSELQRRAIESARRPSSLETFRGAIRDFKNRIIAIDAPCIDAAMDYRAINTEPKESQEWLHKQAKARLINRGILKGDKDDRTKLIDDEVAQIKENYKLLWAKMSEVSGKTPEELEDIKQTIVRKVDLKRRYVWYKRYEEAKHKHESQQKEPASGWYSWLVDDSEAAPQLDDFKILVSEQTETHAILHAIDNDAYVTLDKLRERCPGLELKKGTRRNYPYAQIGCHVIGNLSPVISEDIKHDPYLLKDDARRYLPSDLIGRSGVERLAEPMLRGARGSEMRVQGSNVAQETVQPIPGKDVQITIDMELQMRIQEAFLHYEEVGDPKNPGADLRVQQMKFHEMHGAAVIIDVASGEVRALVSYPTYDLNEFESIYPRLLKDQRNQPLLNRATQSALEPGSTVKPMVGLSAITAGLVRVDETIECNGYLMQNGVALKQGRCWTMSKFNIGHHLVPSNAPHPTGFLTYPEAIERSCNVYFETLGDRLGVGGLGNWMHQFGLGQYTEIGIAEAKGRVPGDFSVSNPRWTSRFSGIGQAEVLATPLQMANVAATIARRGIWIRPHLLAIDSAQVEHRDLQLDPAAIAAAHQGMINVANSAGGTGNLHRDDMLVAAKTGTAQAAQFNYLELDDSGKPKRDAAGKIIRHNDPPSTADAPNPQMPWYRGSGMGSDLGHAWFIGFAPAHDPKIAFAVMAEYGGSGGHDAGPFVQVLLDACVEHGYLSKSGKGK